MTLHDYRISQQISMGDPPFAALMFAALRKADTMNAAKLRAAWPELCAEMQQRYDAPGGAVTDDEMRRVQAMGAPDTTTIEENQP